MISLSNAPPTPQDAANAQSEIDAVKADPNHSYWRGDPKAQERMDALYKVARPGALPPKGITVKIDESAPTPPKTETLTNASGHPGGSTSWIPPDGALLKMDSSSRDRLGEEALEARRQAMRAAGTPNPARFHLTPRGLERARPPEPLDVTDIPAEDREAAHTFHEATGAQAFTTRRWLDYARTHVPLGEDEAWEVLNAKYGQDAGRLVYDAQEAYHHKDFPPAIKQFIERHQLENDAPTLAALAEWYRDRQGR